MKRDKGFAWNRVDASTFNLKGMKVAIVGGTGGIGRAFSRFMAARGAGIVVVGQTFRDSDVPGIEFIKADLSLMREANIRSNFLGQHPLRYRFMEGMIGLLAPSADNYAERLTPLPVSVGGAGFTGESPGCLLTTGVLECLAPARAPRTISPVPLVPGLR
jgi:hypothetical protein